MASNPPFLDQRCAEAVARIFPDYANFTNAELIAQFQPCSLAFPSRRNHAQHVKALERSDKADIRWYEDWIDYVSNEMKLRE
jgi:hypothetical protein